MTTVETSVTINRKTIANDFVSLTISGLYAGFFLKFYLEDGENLIKDTSLMGRCITIGLIVSYISIIFLIRHTLIHIANFGKIFTYKEYNLIISGPLILVIFDNLFRFTSLINAMILVTYFIPFTEHNCYNYSKNLCIFPRIIAFFGVITYILFAFALVPIIFLLIMVCENSSSDSRSIVRKNFIVTTFVNKQVIDYVLGEPETCSICLEEGKEGDITFIITDCKHKFHKACFDELVASDPSNVVCPMCRTVIVNTV